ncbi:MAG: TSUP family transporter [Chlamydiales bacterium]
MWEIIFLCTASFLISIVSFFSGFSLSTLLIPLISIFLPVSTAIAITAFIHLVHNLVKFGFLWKSVDWFVVLCFGVPAFLSAIGGAFLLIQLAEIKPLFSYTLFNMTFKVQLINFIIGILLIFIASYDFIPVTKEFTFTKKGLFAGGVVSGFFGGLSGLQGAFRSSVLVHSSLGKESFVGTSAAISSLVDLSRLIIYGSALRMLFVFHQEYVLIAALTLAAFFGLLIGRLYLHKVTIIFIKRLITGLLYLFGLLLIFGII